METVKRANSKIQEHNNKLDKANLSSELSIKDDLKRKLQHLTDTPFKLTVKDIHKFYTHEGLCYDKDKNCSKEDIDDIEDILDEIDQIVLDEEYKSIESSVTESIVDNKINMEFVITEGEKYSVDRINVTGVSFETGLLFNTELSDNKKFSFGLTYQHNTTMNAKRTLLGTTFEYLSSSLIVKNTFQYSTNKKEVVLPSKLSTGLMYSSDKILFVTNYASQNWSDYQLSFGNEIEEDYLDNSSSISAGLQITPDFNSVTKYWKRVNYRIGGRYDKTYLNINENQLTEKSVTFGLGLPVRRSNTFYNIALELGESGTTDDNLIKEQFARFTFGVTFKGIWFVKRKYD